MLLFRLLLLPVRVATDDSVDNQTVSWYDNPESHYHNISCENVTSDNMVARIPRHYWRPFMGNIANITHDDSQDDSEHNLTHGCIPPPRLSPGQGPRGGNEDHPSSPGRGPRGDHEDPDPPKGDGPRGENERRLPPPGPGAQGREDRSPSNDRGNHGQPPRNGSAPFTATGVNSTQSAAMAATSASNRRAYSAPTISILLFTLIFLNES